MPLLDGLDLDGSPENGMPVCFPDWFIMAYWWLKFYWNCEKTLGWTNPGVTISSSS